MSPSTPLQTLAKSLFVILLGQLLAAGMPIPDESGSAEPPASLLDPASEPQEGHRFEFECSNHTAAAMATESPSEEQLQNVGALKTGLEVLKNYSSLLRNNWGDSSSHCTTPPVVHGYHGLRNLAAQYITDESMAAWIGVFRAYSEQVLSILAIESLPQTHQDTMMKLYNVLKSVLEDYRDTMEPYFCDEGCTQGCFTIPEVPTAEPSPDCINIIYNLEYYLSKYDIPSARIVMKKWMEQRGIELSSSTTPSGKEWILANSLDLQP